jgi:hypothetical protein
MMWMGLHRNSNRLELWSDHWIWQLQGIKRFFSSNTHFHIKAALHLQHDGEEIRETASDGKLQLHKVGILLDHMRKKCVILLDHMRKKCVILLDHMREKCGEHCIPGPDIACDNISVLM